MSRKSAREELIKIFGEECMISGEETDLTFHHLHKKCEGGDMSLDNGAIFSRKAHDYVHILEKTNRSMYDELSECICLYKLARLKEERECLKVWASVQQAFRAEMKADPQMVKRKVK